MLYACLIYGDESEMANATEEQINAVMGAYYKFTQDVGDADVMRAGEALHPTAMATSVRVRDGETSVTDGPFAETKEQLGGFYVLDCENLDQAVEWAAQIPTAATGTIEVRPIMVFE